MSKNVFMICGFLTLVLLLFNIFVMFNYTSFSSVSIEMSPRWLMGKTLNNPYKKFFFFTSLSNCSFYVCFDFTDWADEAVEKAEILRLIYQGRFLHSNVTLGALGLVPARTTVMHLVPRETLPEPNSQGEKNRDRTISGHWFWPSNTSSSNQQPESENSSIQDPVVDSQP